MLDAGGEALGVDAGEGLSGLVDAVLEEEVVSEGHEVVGVGAGLVGEDVQEAAVLLGDAFVDDLSLASQGVGSGVDQGRVLEVLVLVPEDGVEGEGLGPEEGAALGDEGVAVLEVLLEGGEVVVEEGVGPEGVVVDVALVEGLDDPGEEGGVLQSPGDAFEVELEGVVSVEEVEDLIGGGVLGDVVPGEGVEA